jgi:nucleoid DNA-binding protein
MTALGRIINELAVITERPADHLFDVARHVLAEIESTALKNGQCTIQGFGTFVLRQQPARMARNPKTGAPVMVPAQSILKFRHEQSTRRAATNSELGRICRRLANHYERPPTELLEFVQRLLDRIEQVAHEEGRCNIKGLGTFRSLVVRPRMARNPRTGAPAPVRARRKLVFSQSESRRRVRDAAEATTPQQPQSRTPLQIGLERDAQCR